MTTILSTFCLTIDLSNLLYLLYQILTITRAHLHVLCILSTMTGMYFTLNNDYALRAVSIHYTELVRDKAGIWTTYGIYRRVLRYLDIDYNYCMANININYDMSKIMFLLLI